MKALTAIILDTRRALADDTYPVKLRITHQRKRKYYAVDLALSESDFAKVQGSKPRGEYKDYKLFFNAIEQRANDIVSNLPEFSFAAFEKNYLDKQDKHKDVYSYYQRYIAGLKNEGRAGTADSYTCSLNSLKHYHKKTLHFEKLTPDFLKGYEQWMTSGGKSLTSVGIYLRALRSICNLAIEEGAFKKEDYPFGKRRYQIPAGRNVKKAISLADIQKLFCYQPETESESRYRDLWLFSYLCSGINMKDICRLRYRNVEGNKIVFIRAKTDRTTKQNQKPIVVMMTPEAQSIIQRWGTSPVHPEAFVFDLLSEGLTPDKERRVIKQVTKTVNKYIKRIAQAVGIEAHVTSYTARHSFATVLKRSGAPIEFISESLGHSDLRITENYLDSFEDDTKRKYASALTAFD